MTDAERTHAAECKRIRADFARRLRSRCAIVRQRAREDRAVALRRADSKLAEARAKPA